MARLICLNSVSQWEREQISLYPDLEFFFNKLKNVIEKSPSSGLSDPILFPNGKIVPCLKKSVNISLFSRQYAFGYNFLTASYIFNNDVISIIRISYS